MQRAGVRKAIKRRMRRRGRRQARTLRTLAEQRDSLDLLIEDNGY
jgi:hypothetical protein